MSTDKPINQDLFGYLLKANTRKSMQNALSCLLTPAELQELKNRVRILDLLEQGYSQRQVAKTLGVAIATVSRGAKVLKGSQNNEK